MPQSSKPRPSLLCAVSEETLRTVLLILYGTGATTREVFLLKCEDVDLRRRIISVSGDRIIQPRTIPIRNDVRGLLESYLRSKARRSIASIYVFVSTTGTPLRAHYMRSSFVRLRGHSGVVRRDGRYREPQMRDLRSTFAVHRIASWIKEGADLNRMLPALSAYMGLCGVTSTERYLALTPGALQEGTRQAQPSQGKNTLA
jgi:integrase